MKRKTYFINGWREGRSYFLSLGRFSEEDLSRMEAGEVIARNGNEFRIEMEEVQS